MGRIREDGEDCRSKGELPRIYGIRRFGGGWHADRRSFLAGAAAAAAGAALAQPTTVRATDVFTEPIKGTGKKKLSCQVAYAHGAEVTGLALTPDGKLLISTAYDRLIKFWSFSDGRLITTLTGHSKPIRAMVLSPDGKYLITGDEGGVVKLWSIKKKRPEKSKFRKQLGVHQTIIGAIAVAPDGNVAVSADCWGGFSVWSLPSGELLASWDGDSVSSIAISPDGTLLASVGISKDFSVWSLVPGQEGTNLRQVHYAEYLNGLAFSTDGQWLIGRTWLSGKILVWRVSDWSLYKSAKTKEEDIEAIAVHPSGEILAVAEETISLWSIPDLKSRVAFSEGGNHVTHLAFTPDGNTLISGNWASTMNMIKYGYEGQIKLWNYNNKKNRLIRCFIDLEATPREMAALRYSYKDKRGRTVTVVVPNCACAPQMSDGAKCVCDTVTGNYCACQPVGGGCPAVYYYPN
jgi:WD40 repeat protein